MAAATTRSLTDKRLALSILLTTADLPDGYSGETDDGPDSGDEATHARTRWLYDCMAVETQPARSTTTGPPPTPGDFAKEQAYVGSSANVFPDEAYAEAAFVLFRSAGVRGLLPPRPWPTSFRDSAEEDNDPASSSPT